MLLTTVLTALALSSSTLAAPTTQNKRNNDGAAPAPTGNALRDLAARAGNKYFGTATQLFQFVDTPYLDQIKSQFNAITPENEMKWEAIQPTEGYFNWTGSDAIFDLAQEVGGIARGHNFCWDSQTPEYVTNITDPERLKSVLKTHIDAVMGRYGNRMAYMDVVNEPLNENGTYKSNVWLNVLGPEYIEIALNYAHAAAPNVKLCINDYNIESVNNKSMAYAALAADLVNRGVPLHCIGFEAHFIGGATPDDIGKSMKQFSDLGLEVPITELDIRIPVDVETDIPTNATVVGEQTVDYFNAVTACLENECCPGITIWQHTDKYSWIPDVFPGEGSALPYDADLQPKAALYAITEALEVFANRPQ